MSVTDNTLLKRFEMVEDGQIVFADYSLDSEVLRINYVESPVPLRGTGAAGRLMDGLMENVRQRGLKVIPICGYAAAWIRRHPAHHDLLA